MAEVPRKSVQYRSQPGGSASSGESASPPRSLVLVVDDDGDIARFMSAVLASRGMSAVSAGDAELGFQLAQREHPAIILVDWHMPAGGGARLLQLLKADPNTASIPVIVVTADSAPNLKAEASALGAKLFLHKPLEADRLIEAIRRFLPEPSS